MTDMAHGGEALGRFEGQVVFVPYAIPGELVRAEILERRRHFARARLLEVLQPSPHRVEPPCPYFGHCGGCHWQHIKYSAQLEYKAAIVRNQLRRLGGLEDPPVESPLGTIPPWGYRNHAQFTVSQDGFLGFLAAFSHQTVPIARCLILDEDLNDLYSSLDIETAGVRRLSLRAGINTGELMLVLEMEGDEPPELELDFPISVTMLTADGQVAALVGNTYFHEAVLGRRFRVSANSFFQVNTIGAEALVEIVSSYLEPIGGEVLLDAYCGVGTFGLSLAERVGEVIGIESHPAAIADAEANAGELENVTLIEGAVEDVLPELEEQVDLAVLDPPRAGVALQVIETLAAIGPTRIAYVSCDPATLARDVRRLSERDYQLVQVQPLDMFPQTYHIECVALLMRASPPR
ncbi:MAG: class I SAM-dependent RNA methyltransferase [Chloroflexi bacterium]|nr:class I SAM-dependent RNA methyltransferase [Chloroflexota bacterium]